MQLQIAMNILYDMMMQCLPCQRNVRDRTTPLICRWMIRCYTLPNIFSYHYPYAFFVNGMSEI